MGNKARLTINGALLALPTLFDSAVFPTRLDRETLIDTIILECGELGLYYADPDYLQKAIKAWSTRRVRIWDEMIDTTEYEYNPIWNKDGTYTEHRKDTRNRQGNENTTALSGTITHTTQVTDDDETITNQVNAYNGGAWADADKSTRKDDMTVTGDGQVDTTAEGERKTKDDETGEYTLERVEQGNIGVTTTQQMIKEQREVIDYDTYYIIADEFKSYFCILVY